MHSKNSLNYKYYDNVERKFSLKKYYYMIKLILHNINAVTDMAVDEAEANQEPPFTDQSHALRLGAREVEGMGSFSECTPQLTNPFLIFRIVDKVHKIDFHKYCLWNGILWSSCF